LPSGKLLGELVVQAWEDLMRLDVQPELVGADIAFVNHPEAMMRCTNLFIVSITKDVEASVTLLGSICMSDVVGGHGVH
jgi:hypothetical protein